jgi:ATP-dependent Clp protease ATP-binding subunit ClpX
MGKKSLGFKTGPEETQEAENTRRRQEQVPVDVRLPTGRPDQARIDSGICRPFAGGRTARRSRRIRWIEILTRPKNAIIKQYQRLFEFENVRLKFSEEATRAIAKQAMARKVGARGLRMILEELMLDLMYHLPSQKKVKEFEVTREMVEKRDVSLAMMDKAG